MVSKLYTTTLSLKWAGLLGLSVAGEGRRGSYRGHEGRESADVNKRGDEGIEV